MKLIKAVTMGEGSTTDLKKGRFLSKKKTMLLFTFLRYIDSIFQGHTKDILWSMLNKKRKAIISIRLSRIKQLHRTLHFFFLTIFKLYDDNLFKIADFRDCTIQIKLNKGSNTSISVIVRRKQAFTF